MILAAARDHSLDLSRSFVVGDRWRDIEMGLAAGTKARAGGDRVRQDRSGAASGEYPAGACRREPDRSDQLDITKYVKRGSDPHWRFRDQARLIGLLDAFPRAASRSSAI